MSTEPNRLIEETEDHTSDQNLALKVGYSIMWAFLSGAGFGFVLGMVMTKAIYNI